jgi:hypothetical protein
MKPNQKRGGAPKTEFVKRPISLPPGLDDFVMSLAEAAAKPTGRKPNFSGALAEIIAERKRQVEATSKGNGHK